MDLYSMAAMGVIEMGQEGCAGHGFVGAVKSGHSTTASMKMVLDSTTVPDAPRLARTRGMIGIMVERDPSGFASVSAVDARTTTPCLETATEARDRAMTGGSVPSDSMSRSSRLRGGMCAESARVAGASTLQHLWLSVSRYTSVTALGKVGMLVCGPWTYPCQV